MALRFFPLPQARKFNFKPRYYDPDLEERRERESRIKAELGVPDEHNTDVNSSTYRPHIKGQFRKAMRRESKTSLEVRRKSNQRLVLIIAILAILFYFVFYR